MRVSRLFPLLVLATGPLAAAAQLNVFAAASLADVLSELGPRFTAATGHTLRFNFGASGALARQIKEGAPADLILSADELRVDQLEQAGLLLAGTRRTVVANQLVLVVPSEPTVAIAAVADLARAEVRRVAVGDPATVPAGTYAKAYLQKTGQWKPLLGKLVPVESVRAVLAAVESGNVEAGFVYRTDALISKKVRIAVAVPLVDGSRITYPVAVLKESRAPEAAWAFVAFLMTEDAQKVFDRYGFLRSD